MGDDSVMMMVMMRTTVPKTELLRGFMKQFSITHFATKAVMTRVIALVVILTVMMTLIILLHLRRCYGIPTATH